MLLGYHRYRHSAEPHIRISAGGVAQGDHINGHTSIANMHCTVTVTNSTHNDSWGICWTDHLQGCVRTGRTCQLIIALVPTLNMALCILTGFTVSKTGVLPPGSTKGISIITMVSVISERR